MLIACRTRGVSSASGTPGSAVDSVAAMAMAFDPEDADLSRGGLEVRWRGLVSRISMRGLGPPVSSCAPISAYGYKNTPDSAAIPPVVLAPAPTPPIMRAL